MRAVNDAMIIVRDIAGDVSQKAANKVRPSEEQLSQVDEPAEENTWHEAPDFSKHKEQMKSKFKKNKESVRLCPSDTLFHGISSHFFFFFRPSSKHPRWRIPARTKLPVVRTLIPSLKSMVQRVPERGPRSPSESCQTISPNRPNLAHAKCPARPRDICRIRYPRSAATRPSGV